MGPAGLPPTGKGTALCRAERSVELDASTAEPWPRALVGPAAGPRPLPRPEPSPAGSPWDAGQTSAISADAHGGRVGFWPRIVPRPLPKTEAGAQHDDQSHVPGPAQPSDLGRPGGCWEAALQPPHPPPAAGAEHSSGSSRRALGAGAEDAPSCSRLTARVQRAPQQRGRSSQASPRQPDVHGRAGSRGPADDPWSSDPGARQPDSPGTES